MRADTATLETLPALTLALLDALELKDWKVKIIERFTAPRLADKVGYCEVTARTIWLTTRGLNLETVQHEVAHCLQPAEQFADIGDDVSHGPDFEAALGRVRKVMATL